VTESRSSLDELQAHRSMLLGCETIGWLHMAGKAHTSFLRQHGGQKNSHKPKKWASGLVPALSWLPKHGIVTWPTSLSDFLLSQFDDHKSKQSIVGLLQAAHAMASGIEKNHPSSTTYLGQKNTTHMWRTTAFGHPVRNLLDDPPDVLREGGWDTLLANIANLLDALKNLGQQSLAAPADDWHRWRDRAIGEAGWLRQAFTQTLAETRLPNNDVTLWDQSYVAAALFKSAVAGALLQGKGFNWTNNLKQNTRWRVLTVGMGAGHYEARAVRIGDWTGARSEIDRFFDAVCKLIEVDLAVGSLLYRDDEVLAFSFPGVRVGENDPEEGREPLRKDIQDRVDGLARKFDTPPLLRLSGSTRSMICMSREVEEAREQIRVPLHRTWSIPKNTNGKLNRGHTCPVCGLRANGTSKSAREKKGIPCEPCRERRRGRLQDWLVGRAEGDSIWISEVADRHDRVALLTFNLGLDEWLDGTAVDSLRAQSVDEWATNNRKLKLRKRESSNPVDVKRAADSLTSNLEESVNKPFEKNDLLMNSLQSGFQHEEDWSSFFDKVVQDRADAPSWKNLEGHDARRAQWLAHQLFRKNASLGRVRRFWETTETFFSELLAQFREIVSQDANRWRVRRCVVTPKDGSWTECQTYAGHWGTGDDAAPLEFICQSDQSLVSICNLARVLGQADDLSRLRDKTIDVIDDDGARHQVKIQAVREAPKPVGTYHPVIVLDRSPARFRLLVPLAAADACVQAAVKKWDTEFARVWDRLPLRVSLVGFPRKLPYQAVVEAARNVEDDLTQTSRETWRVHDERTRAGVTALSLFRTDGQLQIVTVPTTLPDGRSDVFYPNCAVKQGKISQPHDFAAPRGGPENHIDQQIYRWMPDLRADDWIHVAPAQFARVFLDSTARRFSPVLVHNLGDWGAMQETWRLVRQTAPSLTAARALEAILLEKHEVWAFPAAADSGAWLGFVQASLVNLWAVHGADLDTLVEAARRGILQETLAWHLHVLKQEMEISDDAREPAT